MVNNKKSVTSSRGGLEGKARQPEKTASGTGVKLFMLFLLAGSIAALTMLDLDSLAGKLSQQVTKVILESHWQAIDESEVQVMLGEFMGTSYLGLNVLDVQQRLEQHPWVHRAMVRKVWPDSIAISLREEVPIARWGDDRLINENGEIFSPRSTVRFDVLPQLDGPESSQVRVMQQYREISNLFLQAGMRLTALSLSARGNWVLELNERVQVTVGRRNVLARLNRFIDLFDQLESGDLSSIAAVDLRYDNGIAVRPAADFVPAVSSIAFE